MKRTLSTALLTLGLLVGLKCYGQSPAAPPAKERFVAIPAGVAAAARFNQGTKWAIVVGANDYRDPAIPDLQYCVADAKLVADQLVKLCGYQVQHVLQLTDDQAQARLPLRANLEREISGWLKQVKPGDTVFVYFSGHGFLDAAGDGYLAPHDCDLQHLKPSSFRTDDLREMLRGCRGTQKILVLDCCHAGAAKGIGNAVDQKPAKEIEKEIGNEKQPEKGPGNGPAIAKAFGPSSHELGAVFASAEGLVTIASCRKKETSLEWDAKKQGLFTYFLAAGLGGAADFDRDGIVDHSELYRYVAENVPPTAHKNWDRVQMPVQIIGEDVAGIFAMARVAGVPAIGPRDFRAQGPGLPPAIAIAPFGPELAKLHQEAWAQYMGVEVESTIELAPKLVMRLRVVPPGIGSMGSPAREFGRDERSEKRIDGVELTEPFFLGSLEVTQEQFEEVTGVAPWKNEKGEVGNYLNPNVKAAISSTNGEDALKFCDQLTINERAAGRLEPDWKYTLPTEAQWEWACRAGATTPYSFGIKVAELKKYACYRGNPNPPLSASAVGGLLLPNVWGFHDMHGNVWEWCLDKYVDTVPGGRDPLHVDDKQWAGVKRGGSYNEDAKFCRSSSRKPHTFGGGVNADTGFRVALVRIERGNSKSPFPAPATLPAKK